MSIRMRKIIEGIIENYCYRAEAVTLDDGTEISLDDGGIYEALSELADEIEKVINDMKITPCTYTFVPTADEDGDIVCATCMRRFGEWRNEQGFVISDHDINNEGQQIIIL